MEKWLEGLEPIVVHQDIKVPYRYSMGPVSSRFFIEIRDNRKIMGIRCPRCDVVYVPPRAACGRCFSLLHEWVEVGNEGTLETYTRVLYPTPVQPVGVPFYYGIVKLDGADTGLAHMVGDLGGQEPRIGMRVQAVYRDERMGNMLDILHFKPVEQGKRPPARGQSGRNGEKAKRRKIAKGKIKTEGKKVSKQKTAAIKKKETSQSSKVPRPKGKRKK